MREAVEAEFSAHNRKGLTLPAEEIARINAYFALPALEPKKALSERTERRRSKDAKFSNFLQSNVTLHKVQGYAIVTISLKPIGGVPGDATHAQMDALAELMDAYGIAEIPSNVLIGRDGTVIHLDLSPRKNLASVVVKAVSS